MYTRDVPPIGHDYQFNNFIVFQKTGVSTETVCNGNSKVERCRALHKAYIGVGRVYNALVNERLSHPKETPTGIVFSC